VQRRVVGAPVLWQRAQRDAVDRIVVERVDVVTGARVVVERRAAALHAVGLGAEQLDLVVRGRAAQERRDARRQRGDRRAGDDLVPLRPPRPGR
jgi:hypothetical protein